MNVRITEKEIKDLKGINDFWGDQMPMMAMEEAGELIQAISKMERNVRDIDDPDYDILTEMAMDNLTTEMADVLISIGTLMTRYDISIGQVKDKIDRKLGKEY